MFGSFHFDAFRRPDPPFVSPDGEVKALGLHSEKAGSRLAGIPAESGLPDIPRKVSYTGVQPSWRFQPQLPSDYSQVKTQMRPAKLASRAPTSQLTLMRNFFKTQNIVLSYSILEWFSKQ